MTMTSSAMAVAAAAACVLLEGRRQTLICPLPPPRSRDRRGEWARTSWRRRRRPCLASPCLRPRTCPLRRPCRRPQQQHLDRLLHSHSLDARSSCKTSRRAASSRISSARRRRRRLLSSRSVQTPASCSSARPRRGTLTFSSSGPRRHLPPAPRSEGSEPRRGIAIASRAA